MTTLTQTSNVFQGFVTGPDGSVYSNTLHTAGGGGGGIGGAGWSQTWSTLELVSPGTAPGGQQESAATGVNPTETSYSLYGHTIPLTVFGVGRIGGEIIAGPWVENGLASFCISFGVPADPSGTRDLREIAFDSEVVWTVADGFSTEAFTYRFYGGTLTQAADALETAHFGADAVAYRPQILIWFENLPIANTKFGKIPYVSAVIGDASGDDVNLGEAFERLAASPWVNFADFETTGITDGLVDGGLIIVQDTEFLSLIQQFGRFYRSWDILQTDKLRIVDRGNTVTADITLDKSSLVGQVTLARAEPNSIPRELELKTIDPASDFTIVPSKASFPRDPVNVSSSVKTQTAYLPAIMDSSTRQAIVTYAKYQEEVSRKRINVTAMAYGLEIEPGDFVAITGLGDDFNDDIFRVVETLHGANYTVELTAESILRCSIDIDPAVDPYWDETVLLLGFQDSAALVITDESPAEHGIVAGSLGDVEITNTQSKFGGKSLLCDGTGDSIVYLDSADWDFGSGNFTVECWIRPATVTGTHAIVGAWASFSPLQWLFFQQDDTVEFMVSTTGSDFHSVVSGGTMSINTWHAVCVDFDGTKTRLYLNGVMVDSNATLRTISTQTLALGIGATSDSINHYFNGYIDELRITKGVARYASDSGYTPRTSAFPRNT